MVNLSVQLNSGRLPTGLHQPSAESPSSLSWSPTGYLHPLYAESLREFGEPLELPRSGGHLLVRRIPGTDFRDAMGLYPLFCCCDWKALNEDLRALQGELVSVCLVTDPFGDYDHDLLRGTFGRVAPFKEHFVADLKRPPEAYTSPSHRKHARKALRRVKVEICPDPAAWLEDMVTMYGCLVERHKVTGLRAFSRASFTKQLAVPGAILLRASRNGETLGLNLCFLQGQVLYAHLVGVSPLGYKLGVPYALKLFLLQQFASAAHWVDFGAAAGVTASADDGLAYFKRGWASGTRPVFFCGTILSPTAYDQLTRNTLRKYPGYFPAYRDGEFGFNEPSEAPLTSVESVSIASADLTAPEVQCARSESPAERPPPATGYLHPLYAESLREFGEPIQLVQTGGWVLKRRIPECDAYDAMGCYPLFVCRNWLALASDLKELQGGLVSLTLVTDPFGIFNVEQLRSSFHRVLAFKDHHVCDLTSSPESFVSRHHRYYARKSLEWARVEAMEDAPGHLDEWMSLYATLTNRHGLTGIKAFSRQAFAKQLAVPGLVMLRMTAGSTCLGAHLWFIQGDVAYSHLMALSEAGYATSASYGLYWRAIEFFTTTFASSVRWLSLGAGAGLSKDHADGLSQFKKGWSTGIRPSWLLGCVLDRQKHEAILRASGIGKNEYFPAYRAGEFA